MEYRRLGNSDLNISVIGFGAWAMGKAWWGEDVVDEETIAAARKSVELGINFFDTAQAYGCGHSERMLGIALKEFPRDEIIIATKTGLNWDENDSIFKDSSPEYIIKSCDDSMERMQVEYLDLLQIHWPDENVPIADSAAAMKELYDAGKIKAVGVSNFSVAQMTEFMTVCPLHSLQPPYSMLTRGIEAEILPFCREHNIGVLAYSPMARGLLTGKYDTTATFPESDGRAHDPLWKGERMEKNVAAIKEMTALAAERGKTMAQLALAWVLSQPGMTCALSGTKRPAQIEETVDAAGWQLCPETLAKIDVIIAKHGAG